ncbi:MAG: DUF2169 domain-containing protein [Enhygromyxa sp.]
MHLINETHHEAELVRLSLDEQRSAGIVVVKSTYDLGNGNGRPALSRRQRRVLLQPNTEEGVELEPEGVIGKLGVDVVAIGSAAGDGRTRVSAVSIGIGEWCSSAAVYGDRCWRRSMLRWTATDPEPFYELPISWTAAFGGTARHRQSPVQHQGNPLGKGYIVDLDDGVEGAPLPNVEDPSELLERPGQTVTPFGFAPLPLTSALRVEAALDESMSAGVNKSIYNVAPPRHRLPELHGGERCEVRGWAGMAAEVFELPAECFVVEVQVGDREYEFEPRVDTVCLLPGKAELVVTRRASFTYRYARNDARAARLRIGGGCQQ